MAFSALPATSLDAAGKLTAAAVDVLKTALQAAVTKTACATCSVAIQKVLETSSGKVLFEAAARRLQTGSVLVTFATTGASKTQLDAVAAASTSTAFTAAATAAVAAQPGYAGVTAAAPPAAPAAAADKPPLLGLLGLLGLLVVLPLAYFFFCKAPTPLTSTAKPASAV